MTVSIDLDRKSSVSLYRQIADALRRAIEMGGLRPGERLPSTRDLAGRLRVHRKTVMQAFQSLEENGLVTSGVGQGTFVREDLDAFRGGDVLERSHSEQRYPEEPQPRVADGFDWSGKLYAAANPEAEWSHFLSHPGRPDAIRFNAATADPDHFPVSDFSELLQEVLGKEGARVLDYGPSRGHAPLRQWLAERLRQKSIEVLPEQILIVNGSQQGLDLVARLLVRPGDRVLVEEPGYRNGFRLFQALGAEVVGVPLDHKGLIPERLSPALNSATRLLYTMPIFQNPTATSLAEERIAPILEMTRSAGVPILEDHFDAELLYEGEAPVSIKSRDEHGQVILLGTFSKILFPGLRLGWLVLPRDLVQPMEQLKQKTDLSSSLLTQWAMDLFCRRGQLDAHLSTVTRLHRRRLAVVEEGIRSHFPSGTTWLHPRGGMSCWVDLPREVNAFALAQAARREGVELSPGPLFYPNGGGENQFRLVYVRETEHRIRQGIETLGRIAHELKERKSEAQNHAPFL